MCVSRYIGLLRVLATYLMTRHLFLSKGCGVGLSVLLASALVVGSAIEPVLVVGLILLASVFCTVLAVCVLRAS